MTVLFDYLLKEYEKEGKMHLIIGIGCTGGQHRSVSLTNYFADHYSKVYQVHRLHRDADHYGLRWYLFQELSKKK